MPRNSIHPTAEVHSGNIGEGTVVWQNSIILGNAVIGNNCNINSHCFIENDVTIGNSVTIKCGVYLWDGIRIEDNVFIGPNATFTNDLFPRSKRYPGKFVETIIEEGASIGAGAIIIAGTRIGRHAMIGAESVVTKNITPHSLWYGNPARMKGYVSKCGTRLTETNECPQCGDKYALTKNGLEELH
jgi:UDP-2-acetamido-3-amino-2,3-dideoxy-glucuronate N-acetyltransferase